MSYAEGRLGEAYTVRQGAGCNAAKVTDLGFGYSPRGDVTGVLESTPNSGGYYSVGATYWANGLLDVLGGIGLPNMTYTPDGEGRVSEVTASAGGQNPVTATTYSPGYGLTTQVSFGSGDSDAFSYDVMGRMNQYNYTVNGSSVVGNLAWNPNGTLANVAITDPFTSGNNQTCAYTHDDLTRISTAECGGNPLANSGFENGNSGWILGSAFSIVDNPANAQSGNWYMSGSSTTNESAIAIATSGSDWIPVTPGELISYGGWIERVAGTGMLTFDCEVADSNHNLLAWCPATGLGDGSGGTGWEYYSVQYTIPANAAYLLFFAAVHCCGDTDSSLTTGYFDSAFVEGSSVWSQTFSFDPFGNINKTGNNGGISFQPTYTSSPSTNQYSSIPGVTGPYYDADGNLLKDGFYTYTWDADGNSVTAGGIGLTFDAFDRTVEENSSGSYTQFVYGPDGRKLALMNGQTLYRGRVPLPAGGSAGYTSGPTLLRYWHPDWQRSIRMSTNTNQTVFMDGAFAPYGEEYAGAPIADFTGQVADTQPYLYDFLYREYHPVQGRWISPDPAGLSAVEPGNPQSWNRYAYVLNNPLANIDPLGFTCYTADDGLIMDNGDGKGCADAGIDPYPPYTISIEVDAPAPQSPPPLDLELFGPSDLPFQLVAANNGTVKCSGSARVLQGNAATIGKPGGFSGPRVGNFPVTANGAAVIPSQWAAGKTALRPFINQVSGVFPKVNASFQGLVDTIGSTTIPHVQTYLMNKFFGDLIIELPGATQDYGVTTVTATVPSALGCPAGTVQVP
jgi:RHS repeat-associated protein